MPMLPALMPASVALASTATTSSVLKLPTLSFTRMNWRITMSSRCSGVMLGSATMSFKPITSWKAIQVVWRNMNAFSSLVSFRAPARANLWCFQK